MEKDNSIKEEWIEYYKTLENIRKSGIVNMYGAAPYLADLEDISEDLARKVLSNWMTNYTELNKRFSWQ